MTVEELVKERQGFVLNEKQRKLQDAIGVAMDMIGPHTSEMIEPFRYWLKWAEDATKTSDRQ